MKIQCRAGWLVGLALGGFGCTPGYINADSLESRDQGPSACAKSCEALGMRMTAMVLVGDSVPGCVCQPLTTQPATPPPDTTAPTPPAALPTQPQSVNDGAAASTTGYVVLAAVAAARQQQEQQRLQAQQATKH